MNRNSYEILKGHEHCHRCGTLGPCTVRWNNIRETETRKTALCLDCAPKEQEKK